MQIEMEPITFHRSGVIEGFYGKSYSQRQRRDLIQFLAEQGLNEYIYAPKDDPYHREQWRDPYPDSKLRHFRRISNTAQKKGLRFTFALSPGLSIDYESDADRDHLITKFQAIYELNCRSFALLLDDISPHPPTASLALQQADLLVRLSEKFPEARWTICPTEYHGNGKSEYLATLGNHLPRQVSIFWTGPEICSFQITTEYVRSIAEVLQRPPLIWDNYPVNDASMTSRLHLRPLIGRDATLPSVAEGLVANPMTQFEASKIALMTIAAYCRNPQSYDPEMSLSEAIPYFCEPEEVIYLEKFIQYSSLSSLYPYPARDLLHWIGTLIQQPQSEEDLDQIQEICDELRETSQEIINLSNVPLRRELRGWAKRLQKWADFGEKAIRKLKPVWIANDWDTLIERKVYLRELQPQLLRLLADRKHTMAMDALYEAAWKGIFENVQSSK